MADLKFRRILLKLSGEALAGSQGFGIDPAQADFLAQRVLDVVNMGVQIAVVIGAGNLWRGQQDGLDHGMERVTADHMGMLATVMNSLAIQDALERLGAPTRVMTGIEVRSVAEPYIQRRAVRQVAQSLVGLEIMDESQDSITLHCLVSMRDFAAEVTLALPS
jgi:uridylate kinase